MIVELGHFALILALCVALMQALLPILGTLRNDTALIATAAPVAVGHALLVIAAYGTLTWAFVDNDFSVRYVAANSNSALPLAYRVAAVWGGHEGSMLLWTLMLSLWTLAVVCFSRGQPRVVRARVLAVLGAIGVGFLLFLLFTSNPFLRLLPPAMEGRDLNPLLQDPGMVLHPPLLYMGYVGFAVVFAYALAGLMGGQLDAAWARQARPWTTLAWSCLTIGIMLGSAWAYYELGWGGWWFWDPVENASLMPWLAGTALMHTLAMTEKRGVARAWTALLAIVTFSLSLLGTFLVRSGVLTSVHAFAVDPRRGIFILALLGLVTGGALALYAWRAPRLSGQLSEQVPARMPFGAVSRETFLLANNVLLATAAATVLLGTLYPLVLDVLGLGKISVGPAYFEEVFVPLMAPAVLLMGMAPLAQWRHARLPGLLMRLRWAAMASLLVAVALLLLLRNGSALTGLGLWLACWCVASAIASLAGRLRAQGTWHAALRRLPAGYYGMLLAHVGVGVFIAGATLVKSQESTRELPMRVGSAAELGAYTFRLEAVAPVRGPNFEAFRAMVTVQRDGRLVATLLPERRVYRSQAMPTTEAAIDSGFARDLYVAIGEGLPDGVWAVRLHVKPFVNWIWGGCVLMALGGLTAMWDRRYRYAPRRDERRMHAYPAGETATAHPSRMPDHPPALPLPASKEPLA